MKDILNLKIKRRESFRPFAPSILREPVVCRPEEALDCFLRTKMDVLVMGKWVVERGAKTSRSGSFSGTA